MNYKRTVTSSRPSRILSKIEKYVSIEKMPLTEIDINMLNEDKITNNETLVRILETCKNNNLNINEILYKTDRHFLVAPRAS